MEKKARVVVVPEETVDSFSGLTTEESQIFPMPEVERLVVETEGRFNEDSVMDSCSEATQKSA